MISIRISVGKRYRPALGYNVCGHMSYLGPRKGSFAKNGLIIYWFAICCFMECFVYAICFNLSKYKMCSEDFFFYNCNRFGHIDHMQ